jgi:hypothetical protein
LTELPATVRQLIDFADEDLRVVKDDIDAYAKREPMKTRSQFNRQGTEEFFFIEIREPIPDSISWRTGDCAHRLRCALDHLIWQSTGIQSRRTGYPIKDHRADFFRTQKKGPRRGRPSYDSGMYQIIGLRPLAQAFVESTQPYQRTGPAFALSALQWLDNTHKHQRIPVASMVQHWMGHRHVPGATVHPLATGTFTLVDGTYLTRVSYATPNPQVRVNLNMQGQIGVPHPDGSVFRLAGELEIVRYYVVEEVLRPLAALLR